MMDEHEKSRQSQAAQDQEATQFVTMDMISDESPRRIGLFIAIALGVLLGVAVVVAIVLLHRH